MAGKYIYGIIDNSNKTSLGIAGVGGSDVYIMGHQGIGCVLSDYSGGELASMSKEKVVQSLLIHQLVVEHAMREDVVLPAKFGTILPTAEDVCDLLNRGYQQFLNALAWIGDKVEVEVAATWDIGQVLQEIGKEEEIVRARKGIAGKPEQHALAERIRLGQIVKASMDQRRDSFRERMIDFLKPVAIDVQSNALVCDEMVMNVAFLVDRARQEEFDSRVRQLDSLFQGKINFRIIGPLPSYSFATIEVTKLNPEKIEEAKQLLHLGEAISEPEVRRAYRHLAAEAHPDRKPGDELAKMRFAKLRLAADLIIAHCRSQAGSGGGLLINIRRLRDEELRQLSFAEGVAVAGALRG